MFPLKPSRDAVLNVAMTTKIIERIILKFIFLCFYGCKFDEIKISDLNFRWRAFILNFRVEYYLKKDSRQRWCTIVRTVYSNIIENIYKGDYICKND